MGEGVNDSKFDEKEIGEKPGKLLNDVDVHLMRMLFHHGSSSTWFCLGLCGGGYTNFNKS